jgi:tetratricopeptide (TPR) repeat protein
MSKTYVKGILYGLLCVAGLGCLAFATYQQRYARVVAMGNQAVIERRFDSQAYERARHFWFARQDMLLFNQGVLAYEAQRFPRAAEYFREALQRTSSMRLRSQALYNLGMVMLALDEVERAIELFKEALRLDPLDKDTKFNLERLYHFVLRREGKHGTASLRQGPMPDQEAQEGRNGDGQGRSSPPGGI